MYPLRLDNIVSKAAGRWNALTPFGGVDGHVIRHAIEQEQPDFIYLASPASLGFQILLQLRLLSYFAPQVPVLANFQTDLSTFAELMFSHPVSSLSVWVLRTVQGYLFSHPTVKKVFYPSARVKDYLIRANVQADKLQLLQRGVDTDLFHPSCSDPAYKASLAGKNGKLVLLSVCRLSPEKGFDFLANVAHALHRAHFPFHLHIVGGNNSPAVVDSIKALFASLPSDLITFSGLLQGPELARAVRKRRRLPPLINLRNVRPRRARGDGLRPPRNRAGPRWPVRDHRAWGERVPRPTRGTRRVRRTCDGVRPGGRATRRHRGGDGACGAQDG